MKINVKVLAFLFLLIFLLVFVLSISKAAVIPKNHPYLEESLEHLVH